MKKAICLVGCLVGALMTMAQTRPDQSKIVVLTDPHVMSPQLLVSEGTAWTNYLAQDRKLIDYSRALFDEMVTRIKDDIQPGLVLITGDLSKDGEVLSHEYVVSKLDELKAQGIQTLVVPGNHDRGANGNAVFFDGSTTTPAEVATDAKFATLYANYGYGETSQRDPASLSFACEPLPDLVVIGIDSGTGGVISDATLSWICQQAEQAQGNGKWVVAMMHHPLEPHFCHADKFINNVSVAGYEHVRNQLADAGISVLFTGHFHTSDILKDYNADLSKEIYDISTGALASFPCDYRVLTLNRRQHQLAIETAHIESLPGVENFAAKAEERLKTAVQETVSNQGGAYALVAGDAAAAFVQHAKGNENDSPEAQSILSTLKGYASLARTLHLLEETKIKQLEDMANSMLQDLSNYGVEGRENRVDDLTLTIPLPEITSTAIEAVQTQSSSDSWYTLGGTKLAAKPQHRGLYIHRSSLNGERKVIVE